MEYSALQGLGVKPRRPTAYASKKPPEPEPPQGVKVGEPAIVRTPRVIPSSAAKAVGNIKAAEELHGGVVGTSRMGKAVITQQRREFVLEWMLNGHQFQDQLMTIAQLAQALGEHRKVIEYDVKCLKDKMAEWHIEGDQNEVAALAYMLMEMKFQDRGRALALYNRIIADINTEDAVAEEFGKKLQEKADKNNLGKLPKLKGSTGRDRAAMYNVAMSCLDLSNKAVNGMESLFKITGGAKKLQAVINARQVVLHQNNLTVSVETLHQFVDQELACILPSSRKAHPELPAPTVTTELTADEVDILKIGAK